MRKYEKPMLLDLEEVCAAEAAICDTGGSAAPQEEVPQESFV
jgi:hypothetical protein